MTTPAADAARVAAVARLCSGRPGYHTVTVKQLLTAMSDAVEARQVPGTPTTDTAPAAPLSEVWAVWCEDELIWGHFATPDDARQGTIDCWQETEPSCPDYSWREYGPRLELIVGGEHSGVYASRHRVHGTSASAPAAPADRAAVLRDVSPHTLATIATHLDARAVAILRPESRTYAEWQSVVAELRRLADEAQPTEDDEGDELVCVDECGLCDACGLEMFGTPAEGWREAARFLRRTARDSGDRQGALRGARMIETELRRQYDEAPQPQAEEFREWLRRQPVGDQPITLMAPAPPTLAPPATAATEEPQP